MLQHLESLPIGTLAHTDTDTHTNTQTQHRTQRTRTRERERRRVPSVCAEKKRQRRRLPRANANRQLNTDVRKEIARSQAKFKSGSSRLSSQRRRRRRLRRRDAEMTRSVPPRLPHPTRLTARERASACATAARARGRQRERASLLVVVIAVVVARARLILNSLSFQLVRRRWRATRRTVGEISIDLASVIKRNNYETLGADLVVT